MKSQIALLAVLFMGIVALSNGQAVAPNAAPTGLLGPPSFCQVQLNILQSQANKINTPDLDEDLKLRIADVLESAAAGCSDCEGLVIWLNKLCIVVNLRTGLGQLSQIKTEADARAAAAAAATAAPTAAPAAAAGTVQ